MPFLLVTIAPKSEQSQQSSDKENVSNNSSNNRAILAISVVQKAPVANRPMNVDEKSVLGSTKTDLATTISASVKKASKNLRSQPVGQRQYEYAEIQKKRKDLLIQRHKEQEEKAMNFQFLANPAPKFKSVSLKQRQFSGEDKKLVKYTTLPQIQTSRRTLKENAAALVVPSCHVDPERLKYLNEKKKSLAIKCQDTYVQFKAKPAAVLKRQPFQPVHNTKLIDSKPFKLQLTERLFQRGEFDKKLNETIAIRKQQEEIRQRQQAFEDRKLIRQKTEFRARVNPFRNHF